MEESHRSDPLARIDVRDLSMIQKVIHDSLNFSGNLLTVHQQRTPHQSVACAVAYCSDDAPQSRSTTLSYRFQIRVLSAGIRTYKILYRKLIAAGMGWNFDSDANRIAVRNLNNLSLFWTAFI
jgi:hypothetical protein